ncbi:MAG TPA: histone deacetylase [Bryobacteraceae bacterium]|jgi:acetoin utilization deacetylase AcuC-like enzyme|nr:histone deacetylase [Bryobacteraceae bacterium]
MLPFKLVYHPGYDLNLGAHVFPSRKYRLIHDHLLDEGFAEPMDFIEPPPASDEDILRVHEPGWVQRLKTGTLTPQEILRLEIPYSRQLVEAFWLATGGTMLAARNAIADGIGFNIGGGFHHAFPGHGEGFCAIHDVAVAIRLLQHERLIERALVVDCDVHHGNGTAAIFAGDRSVLTLSMHQFNNYPSEKPPSVIDIHLPDGVSDEDYLDRLRGAVKVAMSFAPNMIYYLAGADPYREDQLGGLSLTMEGLKQRDRVVFETGLGSGVPTAVVLAGGYARNTDDTVAIHCNTAKAAREALVGP